MSYNSKLSKEEYRKQKELDEARKAGTVPAELDEDGNEINPHIPQYISQAPWYLNSDVPSLKHQRKDEEEITEKISIKKGLKSGPAATKFRKGACANCGAMTHKQKDCLERPRKVGAKFSGKDIRPDEFIVANENGYDGKRDMWKSYDPKEHDKLFDVYNMIEDARKKRKTEELDNAAALASSSTQDLKKVAERGKLEYASSDDSDDDDDKYAEKSDMVGQKVDTKSRLTVRNLRIREDTAKYLRNLDINSAYYDPKTRSMRDNPNQDKNPSDLAFAGDNFVRYSGDASKMAQMELQSLKAQERGEDSLTLQANPTLAELNFKKQQEEKNNQKDVNRISILEKYGGIEHLENPHKDLLTAQSEHYVEYSRTGKVIKGQERIIAKSKYEEDVYPSNHTSIFGSYWHEGQWGYKCCHSFMKNSYCIPIENSE